MKAEKTTLKRGRPPIDEPATARVEFRATPTNKTEWKKKAAGKSLGAWLTDLANNA